MMNIILLREYMFLFGKNFQWRPDEHTFVSNPEPGTIPDLPGIIKKIRQDFLAAWNFATPEVFGASIPFSVIICVECQR